MARSVQAGRAGGHAGEDGASTPEHSVTIEARARMMVRGVEHVESFDEAQVVLITAAGRLLVSGSDLSIKELNLDEAMFSVSGRIDSMQYSEAVAAGERTRGLLGRMFR